MGELGLRSCETLSDSQLAGIRAIYQDAFPAHLRVPFDELARIGPADQMFVALDDELPVGFAALKLLTTADWVFLRYFAVSASQRRQHVGLRLWHLVQRSTVELGWPGRFAFEVEDPADADDAAELILRRGRIAFWSGCGAVALPVPGYVMPDFSGLAGPEGMLLMAAAYADDVDADEVGRLVRAIYTERYGLRPDDNLVIGALSSISDQVGS